MVYVLTKEGDVFDFDIKLLLCFYEEYRNAVIDHIFAAYTMRTKKLVHFTIISAEYHVFPKLLDIFSDKEGYIILEFRKLNE